MAKTARQFWRAVKNWVVGDEFKETRQRITRRKRAEKYWLRYQKLGIPRPGLIGRLNNHK
jgi:hypothetical protein